MNVWLATFDLIPLGRMDGRKVFSWRLPVWLLVTLPRWMIVFLIVFAWDELLEGPTEICR